MSVVLGPTYMIGADKRVTSASRERTDEVNSLAFRDILSLMIQLTRMYNCGVWRRLHEPCLLVGPKQLPFLSQRTFFLIFLLFLFVCLFELSFLQLGQALVHHLLLLLWLWLWWHH